MAENEGAPKKGAPPRPTIALPPRENFFLRGASASPGPMTLVSSFFSDTDPESDCRSFSQLLAGAMASPGSRWLKSSDNSAEAEPLRGRDSVDGPKEEGFRSKQSRPMSLVMAQSPGLFTIPAGLSPGGFLDSPGFFSSGQGHFGMISHQQALAQVTAQAAQSQSQSHMHIQAEFPPSLTQPPSASSSYPTRPAVTAMPLQQKPSLTSDAKTSTVETMEVSHSDQRSQPPFLTVDKPDDGYNWRKYGQKQVKGSEYPRSYYKCSHPNCPVKKKMERSVDGQVTEIIYKGQHNHQQLQPNKRAKEGGLSSGSAELHGRIGLPVNSEMGSQGYTGNIGQSEEIIAATSVSRKDQSGQATPEQLSGSSDGEEVGDAEVRTDAGGDSEPDPKRRHIDVRMAESASSQRTVSEPRIIVQATSEVDLLYDGYRWRKYGQKVVKGNPYPRSYYKCTNVGCNVRKHVERASTDPKAVITTYEGKHNHDVPVAKNSSHNTASNTAAANGFQLKPVKEIDFRNNNVQQPVSLVRLKEEREAV